MPARRKIVSHAARRARDAMVENLRRCLELEFPGWNETRAYNKIQEDTGISLSSMQRIMSGDTGPSIDTLADLAHRLGTTPQDLLTPQDASQPNNGDSLSPLRQRLQRRRASP